jgi:hypothetical protein
MIERRFQGSNLEEELKKAEQEAGLLADEENNKKEIPNKETNVVVEPFIEVKTPEQIALNEAEKEEKISDIKDQIEKLPQPQAYEKTLNPETSADEILKTKMEEIGKIEGFTKRAIDELISGAKTEEDKKVFTEILDKVNQIKEDLLKARMNFYDTQKHQGTIETMKKFSKEGNLALITKNPQLAYDMSKGFNDKDSYSNSTTIVDLNKVTPDQFQQIMEAFKFSKVTTAIGFPNKDSVFNAYNFEKSFWKKKAKDENKKYSFSLTSNTPGIMLKSHKDEEHKEFMGLSLNQDFVKEILSIN